MHQDDGFIMHHRRRNKRKNQNQKDSADSIAAVYVTPAGVTGPQQATPVGLTL